MLIVIMMICGDHIHDLANVIMSIITGRAIAQRLDMRNTRKAFRRKQRNPGHLLLLAKGKMFRSMKDVDKEIGKKDKKEE